MRQGSCSHSMFGASEECSWTDSACVQEYYGKGSLSQEAEGEERAVGRRVLDRRLLCRHGRGTRELAGGGKLREKPRQAKGGATAVKTVLIPRGLAAGEFIKSLSSWVGSFRWKNWWVAV